MVVDRDRESLFRWFLANDVLFEEIKNLFGFGQIEVDDTFLCLLGLALFDDFIAQLDALVADVHSRTSNELLNLLLALSAKRAL